MSPKAKILSVLKGEIKYFFCAAGAKFFEKNSCQSGFSFRKIVFGKRFREEFSEKNPTWEVSISEKFRACGARKTTSLPKRYLFEGKSIFGVSLLEKSCGAFKEIFYLHTSHRQKSSETDRGDRARRTSCRAAKESAAKLKPGMQTLVARIFRYNSVKY